MLLTPEKNSHRIDTTCSCGNTAEHQVGKRDFLIGPRKITINNIPHFYCSYCDKAIFDSTLPVDDLLKYAFRNKLSVIDWEDKALYI